MYEKGLVSIIMPAYNAESNIEEAINSVLTQTYKHLELIVVNDCSTDSTKEIVERNLKLDKRILLINNDKNLRVAKTRNRGIAAAKGQYIAFLDSDDVWLPNKLSLQINDLKEKGKYFSFGTYDLIDSNSNRIGRRMIAPASIDYKQMLKGSKIGCLTVLIDRTKVKRWHEMKSIGHEDYLMWLEFLRDNGPAHGIEETIGLYRVSSNSLSSNKYKAAKWQYRIYREELEIGIVESSYYMFRYFLNAIFKYSKVSK